MTLSKNENLQDKMLAWVERFIVALNICPFARRELENQTIDVVASNANQLESALEDFALAMDQLDQSKSTETTLIVFDDLHWQDFLAFVDLIDYADQLIDELHYRGKFQIAHFHPQYQFEGEDEHDPANYTNRSPYPCLHLLREASMESALKNYPDPEMIPENNIQRLRDMGVDKIKDLMSS